MILEFLQTLSEMQIVGELTVLSLLIGGIIMAGGVIIAKIAKLLFGTADLPWSLFQYTCLPIKTSNKYVVTTFNLLNTAVKPKS